MDSDTNRKRVYDLTVLGMPALDMLLWQLSKHRTEGFQWKGKKRAYIQFCQIHIDVPKDIFSEFESHKIQLLILKSA